MHHPVLEPSDRVSISQTFWDKSVNTTNESTSKPALATSLFGVKPHACTTPRAGSSGNVMTAWPQYMVDAFQRSVLFLDLLRQRGNEEIEITARPMATVLRFGQEVLIDGRSLPRPINYALSRIVPPPGVETDPRNRPVVVADPRAGQGPGIGGFKAESEIGDALKPLAAHEWGDGHTIDHKAALHFVITWLEANLADMKVVPAGHRVALGGTRFEAPTRIEGDVLDYLESLTVMEPSHQAFNVRGARALAEAFPGLPQVACFDRSFHRTMPEVAQTYALPRDVRDAGARHWGYHGISYDYISRQVPKFAPQARRVIAAHLGGGASMCAMLDGRSVETTIGFAGVSGLPMATRSGDMPPGVLFYLLRRKLFDDASLEKMLYERSGLLGLSGSSGDMRVLQESTDPRAVAAMEYFICAMTKYAGAYAAVLGGPDAFVFTAGIGEHSAPVRAALCGKLAWLGVKLDAQANASGGPRISTQDSGVSLWSSPPMRN
jgi:acetate kinase